MRARGGIVDGRSYIEQLRADRKARRAGQLLDSNSSIQPVAPKRERGAPARLAMPAEDRIEGELRAGLKRNWQYLTDAQRRAIVAAVTSGLPIGAAVTR